MGAFPTEEMAGIGANVVENSSAENGSGSTVIEGEIIL